MSYEDPFSYSPVQEETQNWRTALVYTVGPMLMLLLGLFGNGVLGL